MFNCAKVQFFYLVWRTLEVIASETTALRAYPSHRFAAGPSRSQAHGRPWFLKLLPLKFCSFGDINTYLNIKRYFTNPSPPTKKKRPLGRLFFVGEDGFEPPKSRDSRFTVCPIWPLWNSPSLKPVLITCL